MTGSWSRTDADGSRVEVIDAGDGTATRTLYDPTGEITSTEQIAVPLPPEPDPLTRVQRLGLELLARHPALVAALDQVAEINTAKPALTVVTEAVSAAATPPQGDTP